MVLMLVFDSFRIKRAGIIANKQTYAPYLNSMADTMICTPNAASSYYLCQNKNVLKSKKFNPLNANAIIVIKCSDGQMIFNNPFWEDQPAGSIKIKLKYSLLQGFPGII